MQRVDPQHINRWQSGTAAGLTYDYPAHVSSICPHCHERNGFAISPSEKVLLHEGLMKSTCPRCTKAVRFVAVPMRRNERNVADHTGVEVYIHPSPSRTNALDLSDTDLSKRLVDEYEDACASIDGGHWRAAATLSRYVLEGAVRHLLKASPSAPTPPPKTPLARMLQAVPAADYAKPFQDLADALKEGGNLAAHFDDDAPPVDSTTAMAMLDLLDAFLEYAFVVPTQVAAARARLEGDTTE